MLAVYEILEIGLTAMMKFVITAKVNNIIWYSTDGWIQYIVV